MRVTIITSLFKASSFLEEFLENVVDQTVFSQCELYLMDANSPENECEIAEPFLKKHSNIKYKKLNKDPGIYGCWNLMIKDSDSEYITNCNVDDKMYPTCIEEHIGLLDKEKNIDVAYCYNAIQDKLPICLTDREERREVFATADFFWELLLEYNLPHNHPVWRRSLHERFGYFNETDYISASDWEFWLRCAQGGALMKLIPKTLGVYYRNPNGISTKKEDLPEKLKEVEGIRLKYSNK